MDSVFRAVLEGEAAVARLLREDRGAPSFRAATEYLARAVPHQVYAGDTALHLAAAALREKVVLLLLEAGADINAADVGGATALHRAVRARSPAAVRQLLALRARTDGTLNSRRSTPLHLATQSTGAGGTAGRLEEQREIIALLIGAGADVMAADAAGRTPQDWATNPKVRELLRR
jgi:ankyrin repeat protein